MKVDHREHARLRRKWAMCKATADEIRRCREMDRAVKADHVPHPRSNSKRTQRVLDTVRGWGGLPWL